MMFRRAMTSKASDSGANWISRLLRDRRGVAALEFAFIAPILLSLYFVTMEVAQGIETNKKVGRVGSMVADLITQQDQMTRDDLDAIMEIGSSILQPYNRSQPTIIVTGIQIEDDATVAWSRKLENGKFSVNAAENTKTSVPANLKIKGTFLVRVESELTYQPVLTWSPQQKNTLGLMSAFDKIDMGETYYLRPRMSSEISCDDCYKK